MIVEKDMVGNTAFVVADKAVEDKYDKEVLEDKYDKEVGKEVLEGTWEGK